MAVEWLSIERVERLARLGVAVMLVWHAAVIAGEFNPAVFTAGLGLLAGPEAAKWDLRRRSEREQNGQSGS